MGDGVMVLLPSLAHATGGDAPWFTENGLIQLAASGGDQVKSAGFGVSSAFSPHLNTGR